MLLLTSLHNMFWPDTLLLCVITQPNHYDGFTQEQITVVTKNKTKSTLGVRERISSVWWKSEATCILTLSLCMWRILWPCQNKIALSQSWDSWTMYFSHREGFPAVEACGNVAKMCILYNRSTHAPTCSNARMCPQMMHISTGMHPSVCGFKGVWAGANLVAQTCKWNKERRAQGNWTWSTWHISK